MHDPEIAHLDKKDSMNESSSLALSRIQLPSFDCSIFAIRFSHIVWNASTLEMECKALVGKCTYQLSATDEQAPYVANCLTSVRYILKKNSGLQLPRAWTANLPRVLIASRQAMLIKTTTTKLCCGDLLFLGARHSSRLTTHIALVIDSQQIYHCRWRLGSIIQRVDELFERYTQEEDVEKFLNYCDPRTSPDKVFTINIKDYMDIIKD